MFARTCKISFGDPFVLDTFVEILFQRGRMWGEFEPKQANVFKGGRSKLCLNIGREDQKGGV
jgi:hypothetical protein